MFWILSILSIMAAFLVLSCLFMLVRAQSRDIAILRTLGASRASVLKIFLLLGMALSSLGIALGLVVSFVLLTFRNEIVGGITALSGTQLWDPSVRILSEMPALTDPKDVVATVILCLLLTLLCTLYPAWKAANTDPVKVLRYD
jgi:lipoprotein-releasing system permease protein